MKKIIVVFLVLLVTFCSIWVFKYKTPINRPDDEEAPQNSSSWWDVELPTADPEWILDPEIPANYIPVPGEDELYMVIDEDGNITGYRHRTRGEDGTWYWEDVDPNIPNHYEPVEGLENVYKVTNADGTVSYFKYIRNEDGTFAFIPVDQYGNELSPESEGGEGTNNNSGNNTDTSQIPDNYYRITGNIYAVYNKYGVCIGYKERRFNEETGEYYWVDVDKPTQSSGNSEGDSGDRDQDTSNPGQTSPTLPTYQPPTLTPPDIDVPPTDPVDPTISTNPTGITTPGVTTPTYPDADDDPNTYTQIETITSTEIKGDWVITYETKVTRVYTLDGVLISTKKEGPVEIERRKLADDDGETPDPSKIKGSLREEYARVSVGLAYQTDLATEVLNILNVERIAAGLPAMRLESNSTAQMLANVKAADMAIYNHSDYDSPLYGTITDLCNRYDVVANNSYEVVWKSVASRDAKDIATRLQLLHPELFTMKSYSGVGLSIVMKGGYYYIDFVLLA